MKHKTKFEDIEQKDESAITDEMLFSAMAHELRDLNMVNMNDAQLDELVDDIILKGQKDD